MQLYNNKLSFYLQDDHQDNTNDSQIVTWTFDNITPHQIRQKRLPPGMEAMEEILQYAGVYIEKKNDPNIWKDADIKIYDSKNNELRLQSGNKSYVIPVTHSNGKTNIVCTKDNAVIIDPKQMYKKEGEIIIEDDRSMCSIT